jgi:transcriptional regulator with XRE-family HTH domain
MSMEKRSIGSRHIPHLRAKLRLLYGYHAFVRSQRQLASELGVAESTLSPWLTGTSYQATQKPTKPDSIPTKYYPSFKAIWGIPDEVLEAEDLAAFSKALESLDAARSPWDRFIRTLDDDPSIEILPHVGRGIRNPDADDESDLPLLRLGDQIMLLIRDPGLRHGVMLLQDRTGWTSLRPTNRFPETEIVGSLTFPRQELERSSRFAEVESPSGVHRVIAILTEESLAAGILQILLSCPIDAGGLNHIARVLQRQLAGGAKKCRVLSRRFVVSASTAA